MISSSVSSSLRNYLLRKISDNLAFGMVDYSSQKHTWQRLVRQLLKRITILSKSCSSNLRSIWLMKKSLRTPKVSSWPASQCKVRSITRKRRGSCSLSLSRLFCPTLISSGSTKIRSIRTLKSLRFQSIWTRRGPTWLRQWISLPVVFHRTSGTKEVFPSSPGTKIDSNGWRNHPDQEKELCEGSDMRQQSATNKMQRRAVKQHHGGT